MSELALVCVAGLLVTWGLYPLSVDLLARLRRPSSPPAPAGASRPLVSVVLATRDAPALVRERVLDLLRAEWPADRLEVVVAADATADAASYGDVAALDARVRIVAGDAPGGKAAGLNAGVRAASGELLVFTDSAQRFDPEAIARLAAALEAPGVAAVSGALHDAGGRRARSLGELYWRYERRLREDEARLDSVVGATGAIWVMRRSLWRPLPAGLILDDVWTPMRLVLEGHRVAFESEARATETRLFTAEQEFRRKVRTLTGVVQLCAWMPALLLPWRNRLWAQFVAHKLLRLATPYLLLGALLGASAAAVGALRAARHPAGLPAALAIVATGALGALLLAPRLRARVAGWVAWSVGLQAAVVVATVNGVRGRWEVWRA